MTVKKPSDYSQEEVCVWLNAIGLGSRIPDFQENAIDGPLLVTLTEENLEGDLGLSTLQIRKFHQSLNFAESLAGGGGYDQSRMMTLEQDNKALREEVASLNEVIKVLQAQQTPAPAYQQPPGDPYYNAPAPAPYYAPAPAPPPQQAPPRSHHQGAPVVQGAAKGAARGAVLGAIGGAIAGDPAMGAKMGAAMGGAAGGMDGLAARRRRDRYY